MRALGIVFAVGVSAAMGCTAILGDFTIGTGGPTGDGGADSAADGSIFKPLTCAPDNNRLPFQFSNFSVSNMSGGKWNGPIYFFDLGNHQARVVMDLSTNTGEVVETFTIDMEQGMVKGVPILEPGRLIAASREPGGTKISALIQDYSAGDVYVRSLADLGSTWDLQTPQNRVGGLGEFKGLCVREAVFGTAGADTFVVVATSTANNCNMADALTAYRLGLTPATAKWMVDASQFSAHGEQIAFDKDNMYVIGSGSSGGPPTSGASPNLYVAARDNLAVAPPTNPKRARAGQGKRHVLRRRPHRKRRGRPLGGQDGAVDFRDLRRSESLGQDRRQRDSGASCQPGRGPLARLHR